VPRGLVVVLVHSRHQYVHVPYSQRLGDVHDGLKEAWHFFGGVPHRVILDNLKPAVAKADRYDPIFQRTCEEYACYRGFVCLRCGEEGLQVVLDHGVERCGGRAPWAVDGTDGVIPRRVGPGSPAARGAGSGWDEPGHVSTHRTDALHAMAGSAIRASPGLSRKA
jgi:hypothetical protein